MTTNDQIRDDLAHVWLPYATEKAVEALFETVRTLAALMEQHAKLTGHEGTARRIADLIADELEEWA